MLLIVNAENSNFKSVDYVLKNEVRYLYKITIMCGRKRFFKKTMGVKKDEANNKGKGVGHI